MHCFCARLLRRALSDRSSKDVLTRRSDPRNSQVRHSYRRWIRNVKSAIVYVSAMTELLEILAGATGLETAASCLTALDTDGWHLLIDRNVILTPTESWGDRSQNCLHDMSIVGKGMPLPRFQLFELEDLDRKST